MTTDISHSETSQAASIDLDAIIRELDAGIDELPEVALRQCQRHSELVTPRLIETIEEATRLGKEGTVREGNAHFFALLLLTEFRAKQALPAILEAMALPEPVLGELFGDAITENFKRTLAVLGEDHPDLIESMLGSRELDDYVRWAAAGALGLLVRDEKLSRDDGVARLMRQLRAAVESRDEWEATIVTCEVGRLNPLEFQDEIKSVFDQGLVDERMIDWECFVAHDLHPDKPGVCCGLEDERPTAIADSVEELRPWYASSDERHPQAGEPSMRELLDFEREGDRLLDGSFKDEFKSLLPAPTADFATIRNEDRHVGRNDPCPCGSGKKYKKCCLRRSAE